MTAATDISTNRHHRHLSQGHLLLSRKLFSNPFNSRCPCRRHRRTAEAHRRVDAFWTARVLLSLPRDLAGRLRPDHGRDHDPGLHEHTAVFRRRDGWSSRASGRPALVSFLWLSRRVGSAAACAFWPRAASCSERRRASRARGGYATNVLNSSRRAGACFRRATMKSRW